MSGRSPLLLLALACGLGAAVTLDAPAAHAAPVLECEPLHDDNPDGSRCSVLAFDPRGHWESGRVRPFISTAIDVGLLYVRPRFTFGYGRPFWLFAGVDLNPIISLGHLGAYGGLRLASPYVDLRIGARFTSSLSHAFLERRGSYNDEQLDSQAGPDANYLTWETELSGSLPLAGGALLSETALSLISGVSSGYNVFEETIRVIADPPFVWRQRIGYAHRIRARGALSIGVVAELVGNPARDLLVLRAGLIVRMQLFYNLTLRGTFIPVIASKDSLGAAGADTFQIGLRWRWAAGD